MSTRTVWDGKDYAVIQMATKDFRTHGEPDALVDADWNLTVRNDDGGRTPVHPGDIIIVDGDQLSIERHLK